MASNRDKLPQLGLWDDEVPKVSHDKIVMWAHENAEQILHQYLSFLPERHPYKDALSPTWGNRAINPNLPPKPLKPTKLVAKCILEKVIQQHSENGRSMPRILGYADLVIQWNYWNLSLFDDKEWRQDARPASVLVEAKTALPSIGELMRQLNLYRLVYSEVVVIAPDARYKSILADQGVLFIPYSESNLVSAS